LQAAVVILYAVAAFIILFGLVYLLSPRIMPYHEKYLERKFEEIKKNDPKMATISLASLKIVGSLALGMGISFVMIIYQQISNGDLSSIWIIFTVSYTALVPTAAVSFSIGGFRSVPGWIISGCLVMVTIAVILTL